MFKYAIAGLLLAESTLGSCPNACSGHGQCGEHDMCTCHVDWLGGDCSERACPTHFAWITTNAHGDVNSDGDLNDVTVYDMDHSFTDMGIPYVVSQNEPHGTWEQWPAYGNTASVDEGHYYMECANRGICDRVTGQCRCFPGYTGHACQRSACPNNCGGHGTCKTVKQQGAQLDTPIGYDLWDKDMSRSCDCDPGFSGPDCNERKCPLGDDPLTTGQANEKQWVDIYTELDTTNWDDRTFSGHIRLKYTDYNGKVWETDDIEIAPYTVAGEGATGAIAGRVEAALNGLPNNVLSGVSVTAKYMEKVIPGNYQLVNGNTGQIAAATNAGGTAGIIETGQTEPIVRCPGAADADADLLHHVTTSAGTLPLTGVSVLDGTTGVVATAAEDDTTCYMVEHPWSLRLEIEFVNTPGDLPDLQVDTSKVIVGGMKESQRNTPLVGSAVSGTRSLAVTNHADGVVAQYTKSSGITTTCAATECTLTSQVIDIASAGTGTLSTGYPVNARVQVTCGSVLRGIYTISSVDTTNHLITLSEDISDCDGLVGNEISLALKSHHITVNADLSGMLAAGDLMEVSTWNNGVTSLIESVYYTASTGVSHVFLTEDFGADETDSVPTDPAYVNQHGDGTTEKEECSSRGLCDSLTGICRCFGGYTGWACSIQNSLAIPV